MGRLVSLLSINDTNCTNIYDIIGQVALGNRDIVGRFDLKKRKYLSNTSMDAELSLIMANQALVRNMMYKFNNPILICGIGRTG
jgi:tRNA G10  N-methylase Trm11